MLFVLNLAEVPTNISCESAYIMHQGEQVELDFEGVSVGLTGNRSIQILCDDCIVDEYQDCDLIEFLGESQSMSVMLCLANPRKMPKREYQKYQRYRYEDHYEAFFYDDDGHVIILPRDTFPVHFFFVD